MEPSPERQVPDIQTATAAEVSCSVFKAKVIGRMGIVTSESAETAICLKHALGYNGFSAELHKQIQVVFTCLSTSCARSEELQGASDYIARFGLPDVRKHADSLMSAFFLAKVGKQAVTSAAFLVSTAANASAASKEFEEIYESIDKLKASAPITVRLLQLDVMPRL